MPRPREKSNSAVGLGAVIGGLLGGPQGALAGGLVGLGIGSEAVSLEESLRRAFAGKNLKFEGLRRTSRFEIHVLFSDSLGRFWNLVAKILPNFSLKPEALDDALYDSAIAELNRVTFNLGTPLPPR